VEAELESKEPTEMGGNVSTSEDEGDQGMVVTSVECREPMATSADSKQDVERHRDVPVS